MSNDKYGGADKQGLRYDAAKMLVDLVSDNDRLGVVHFSENVHSLRPQLIPMDRSDRREELKEALDQARSNDPLVPPSVTNYGAAFGAATALFADSTRNQKAILFLTDGAPSDMGGPQLGAKLQEFTRQNIPIFLMMLKYPDSYLQTTDPARKKDVAEQLKLIQDTKKVFTENHIPFVDIATPADIARTFARVLTLLQPSTYLDTLQGTSADAGQMRFTATASAEQRIKKATFIFTPVTPSGTPAPANFKVVSSTKPDNAIDRSSGSPPQYEIFSFDSTDNQPLNGTWDFTLQASNALSFVFIRSEMKLQLHYPGVAKDLGIRGMVADQQLPLAAVVEGLSEEQKKNLGIRIHPNGCPTDRSTTPEDQVLELESNGLSSGTPVYWQTIKAPQQEIGVTIEYRPINPPVLARCFSIFPAQGVSGGVTIMPPSVSLEDGKIPLQVELPQGIQWSEIQAFVQAPESQQQNVEVIPIDPNQRRTSTGLITVPGTYIIRVVAQGDDQQGTRVALYAEYSHPVISAIRATSNIVDLGTITQLSTPLTGSLELDASLLSTNPAITFKQEAIQPETVSEAKAIQTDLCATPVVDSLSIRCDFTVHTPNNLPSGDYEVLVGIEAPGQDLDPKQMRIRFYRPESRLTLPSATIVISDPITPSQSTVSTSITFTPELWQGDPQIEYVVVNRIEDLDNKASIAVGSVPMELRQNGPPEDLTYELVLLPTAQLPAGNYEASITFASKTAQQLKLPPATVRFSKPEGTIDVSFATKRYQQAIWGIWPVLFFTQPTAYLETTVETSYLSGPPTLEPPQVTGINQEDGRATGLDLNTFTLHWRDDGLINGEETKFRKSLGLTLNKYIEPGIYNVQFRTNKPIREPALETVQIQVLGYQDLVGPAAGYGSVLLFGFVVARKVFRRNRRVFRGAIVINLASGNSICLPLHGSAPLQLALDQDGRLCLKPDTDDAQVSIACINQETIEIDLGGRLTQQLTYGDSLGRLYYDYP